MMKLQLLPLEESIQFRSFGFNWPCLDYFFKFSDEAWRECAGLIKDYNNIGLFVPDDYESVSRPTLDLACKWFREVHGIYVTPYRESIGSDEWVYSYRLEYLPKEFQDYKRRAIHWVTKESFVEGPGSYSGGWDTWGEAQLHGVRKAAELVSEILNKSPGSGG